MSMKDKSMPIEEFDKIKKIAEEEQRKHMQHQFKNKLKHETGARAVIKDKLEARKKLGFKNDWKVRFYKLKLQRNSAITKKLKSLINK